MPKPKAQPEQPKLWRPGEVNLVKGALKARQAEDRTRADAWRAAREAELEAVVNRDYDPMEVPGVREIVAAAANALAPFIAAFDRRCADHYPAEFSRPHMALSVTRGGISPDLRDKIRRDAAVHIAARHRFMLAHSAGFATETVSDISKRATDNPAVREVLDRIAVPNAATPQLDAPGPAIGVLEKLVPHPEEWGFAGYGGAAPAILPPAMQPKALVPPEDQKALPAPEAGEP